MLLERLLAVPRAFDIQNPRIIERASGLLGLWTSTADAASGEGARKWKIRCFHCDDLSAFVKLYVRADKLASSPKIIRLCCPVLAQSGPYEIPTAEQKDREPLSNFRQIQ